MLPPTSVLCLVAEEALFFTCLRSEADCRDLLGLLLVGVGSLFFSGDDLSESDALPLPDPELEDPEELQSNSVKFSNALTQTRVIWISHLLQFCLQFHENVCLCIMKESSGNWKKNGFFTILVLSVLYATISSIVTFSFLSHWSNIIKKKTLPSESKTTDGTLWNTLYMIHCSRKVSVEYIRNEKQRKTSFAEYSTSYMIQEDLQQFTGNQQLIISL